MQDQVASKAQRDSRKLSEAKRLGLLEPLFDYLQRTLAQKQGGLEPTGPEWPYLRAFRDGEAKNAASTLAWLHSRCNISPDGAQNTED
jgi:hypothetical protein